MNLTAPFDESSIRALRAGETVSITGRIFTGRDRLHHYLHDGGQCPVDLKNGAIFHCGPIVVKDNSGWRVVAAGPTTSARENPFMPRLIEKFGIRMILGKGGMNAYTRDACKQFGCVYVQLVGGAAASIAQTVKNVAGVHLADEFGAAEALWEFDVENLTGVVAIDSHGNSLYESVERDSSYHFAQLLNLSHTAQESGNEVLRVVFMGSGEASVPILRVLNASPRVDIVGMITQPDRPAGRSLTPRACPGKAEATKLGIPSIICPEKLNTPEVRAQIAEWNPQVIIVVAYGQFLGQKILDMPPLGCVNVHLSLLPRHRGAAPVYRAIEAGDELAGVTIMKMDAGMDSGPALMQRAIPIQPDDTTGTLKEKLADLGAELIVSALPKLQKGLLTPRTQDVSKVTFANKVSKEEALIDWSLPAEKLVLKVRAFNPWPGCYTPLTVTRRGQSRVERLKILSARAEGSGNDGLAPGTIVDFSSDGPAIQTGSGLLRLTEVQREGGKAMSGGAFLNGFSLAVGALLQ